MGLGTLKPVVKGSRTDRTGRVRLVWGEQNLGGRATRIDVAEGVQA